MGTTLARNCQTRRTRSRGDRRDCHSNHPLCNRDPDYPAHSAERPRRRQRRTCRTAQVGRYIQQTEARSLQERILCATSRLPLRCTLRVRDATGSRIECAPTGQPAPVTAICGLRLAERSGKSASRLLSRRAAGAPMMMPGLGRTKAIGHRSGIDMRISGPWPRGCQTARSADPSDLSRTPFPG